MPKKIVTAAQILAQKNYVQKKFDTDGFSDAVAKYFSENDISATLTIVPVRFVALKNPPECGWIDRTDEYYWENRVKSGEIDILDFYVARDKGLCVPSIAVDEPFCKNAVYMLSIMAGYVLKKKRGGKFVISLV